jgi:hypothetical protein
MKITVLSAHAPGVFLCPQHPSDVSALVLSVWLSGSNSPTSLLALTLPVPSAWDPSTPILHYWDLEMPPHLLTPPHTAPPMPHPILRPLIPLLQTQGGHTAGVQGTFVLNDQ